MSSRLFKISKSLTAPLGLVIYSISVRQLTSRGIRTNAEVQTIIKDF
jgi:hypothetical protein